MVGRDHSCDDDQTSLYSLKYGTQWPFLLYFSWFSLTPMYDSSSVLFSALRRIPGDEPSDRTVIIKKFFLPLVFVCKRFFSS